MFFFLFIFIVKIFRYFIDNKLTYCMYTVLFVNVFRLNVMWQHTFSVDSQLSKVAKWIEINHAI